MRKWRTIACLLVLCLTVPAALKMKNGLPGDVQPLIEKKYGGWSGVLRLWVREGWATGSAAWLNRCIESFERRHPGVYVQPEYVDAGALSAEGLAPEMLLFPPGEVDGERFAPLDIDVAIREDLPRDVRAAPVLMCGYMWAYNAEMLNGVPNTWRGVSLAVPPDETCRHWSAALLALCSSKYSEKLPQNEPVGEIELGLSEEGAANTPAPQAGTLNCELPEDFAFDGDAWHAFINSDAAALLVTPREVRRLEALSDQGPDWQLGEAGEMAFTDQILFIGVVDQENPEKLKLCRAFVQHLLSEDCQGELHRMGAFSVTGAGSGYVPGDRLADMEAMLRAKPVIAPAPFDRSWPEDIASIVREFIQEKGAPSALLGELSHRLRQNPNILSKR